MQAGYVATRAIRQIAFLNHNAGQIVGAGKSGQPQFQRIGRDADTILMSPVGNSLYDSLQATFERRFSRGLAFTLNYTWSKSISHVTDASEGLRSRYSAPCV